MKHLVFSILGSILTLTTFSVSAAPFHYIFSGTINSIELDGFYYSDIDIDGDPATTLDNFVVGDIIEYTFLVDFDLPGFCAGPLGTTYSSTCTGVNIPDSATANYFFTDLVSATKLAPPTEEGTTFNYGLSLSNLGSLVADSAVFIVSPYNIPVENWVATSSTTPGTLLIGTDAYAAPNGFSPYGRIRSTLTLDAIVPVIIDEPGGECKINPHDDHKNKDHGNDDDDSENDGHGNDDDDSENDSHGNDDDDSENDSHGNDDDDNESDSHGNDDNENDGYKNDNKANKHHDKKSKSKHKKYCKKKHNENDLDNNKKHEIKKSHKDEKEEKYKRTKNHDLENHIGPIESCPLAHNDENRNSHNKVKKYDKKNEQHNSLKNEKKRKYKKKKNKKNKKNKKKSKRENK